VRIKTLGPALNATYAADWPTRRASVASWIAGYGGGGLHSALAEALKTLNSVCPRFGTTPCEV